MEKPELTKLTPEGCVVIPEDIRRDLGLEANTQFVIFGRDDTLTLKRVESPSVEDFEKLSEWGTKFAEKKGIKEEDVLKDD